jgi:hypothetical protein
MDQDSVEQEVRVDDLWFAQDCPIVIRAENRLFQVSKEILVARSTVFRDMIAFPQPAGDGVEQMDGCPVVRLHDSAQDVEVFLRAIFDSRYVLIFAVQRRITDNWLIATSCPHLFPVNWLSCWAFFGSLINMTFIISTVVL